MASIEYPNSICVPYYQARILAYIALHQPVELSDFCRSLDLRQIPHVELVTALDALLKGKQIEQRISPVRYRPGDRYLRRDVTTYCLKRGGT